MQPESRESSESVYFNKGNQSWSLKKGSEADVERTLEQLTEHMNEQQRAVFRVKLQSYVHKPHRELILAVNGGQVLGLVCVTMQRELPSNFSSEKADQLKNFAFGSQLLVHHDVRRQGIGASLHLQSLQWARERRRAGHWLITHRMADWYRRHFGYEEFGRINKKGVEKILMLRKFKSPSE